MGKQHVRIDDDLYALDRRRVEYAPIIIDADKEIENVSSCDTV